MPAGTFIDAAGCRHWLSVQPSATSCAQAATLENASDTFPLYTGGAFLGLLGITIIWVLNFAIRRLRRATTPRVQTPVGVVPAIGATIFGGTGVALLSAGLSNVTFVGFWGQGLWFVEAAIWLLIAIGYAIWLLRALKTDTLTTETTPADRAR
jgi:uncharacterized membrane protein SirB2